MTTKALSIIEPSAYAIVKADNIGELLGDMLAPGEQLGAGDLPRIKVPGAGGQAWELPDGEPTKELQGIIIHRAVVRAFWTENFAAHGGGNPPDCSSSDGIRGEGLYGVMDGIESNSNPGGLCKGCPMNVYGTAVGDDGKPSEAKACREITRLFLMLPDSVLPVVVSLPPSSFKIAKQYAVNLGAMGTPLYAAVTGISLVQMKSGGNITYSQAAFRKVGDVPVEAVQRLRAYRESILPMLTGLRVDAEG
jgi:hypothetical protein